MKRHAPNPLLAAVLSIAAGASVMASANAAIVIVNPSFESQNVANGGALLNGITTTGGWTSSGTYLLDNGATQNTWYNESVPDGQQAVTVAKNSYFIQQLTDGVTGPVTALGTSTMTFDISFYVGSRTDAWGAAGTFNVHLQEYDGNAYIGNYALQRFQTGTDADPATIDLNIPQGYWTDAPVNLSLTVPTGVVAGRNIKLAFSNFETVGEGSIDNVSVSLVPESSAALLGGLGLLGLLRRRR